MTSVTVVQPSALSRMDVFRISEIASSPARAFQITSYPRVASHDTQRRAG